MERIARPQDVSWFLDLHKRNQLNLDPPYQRKSVWTRRDKEFFLDTIFNNYPCPPVFLHKTISEEGDTTYHVVDGKQRLQTILEFADNKISIPKSFGDDRLAGKKWNELDPDSKKLFWNYLITVEMLPAVDEAAVSSVFERINRNSRKLERQELRHAKYDGWLIERAEAEADKKEWRDLGVVTTARAKRMNDVQFISELMMITIRKKIVGFDQDILDAFYAEYEVPSEVPTFNEEEFDREFEKIKSFLSQMYDSDENVARYGRTLVHFYSLWGYVLLGKGADVEPAAAADSYAAFMALVARALENKGDLAVPADGPPRNRAAARYAQNVRGANTDAAPRQARHEALVEGLGHNHEDIRFSP